MKELKFRVWDKLEEKMKLPTLFRLSRNLPFTDDNNNGEVYQIQCNGNQYIEYYNLGQNIILMQFTGLTDKNGKEIYEGDICCCDDDNIHSGSITNRVVKWNTNTASFLLDGREFMFFATLEVIGNIYENPEIQMGEVK